MKGLKNRKAFLSNEKSFSERCNLSYLLLKKEVIFEDAEELFVTRLADTGLCRYPFLERSILKRALSAP